MLAENKEIYFNKNRNREFAKNIASLNKEISDFDLTPRMPRKSLYLFVDDGKNMDYELTYIEHMEYMKLYNFIEYIKESLHNLQAQ